MGVTTLVYHALGIKLMISSKTFEARAMLWRYNPYSFTDLKVTLREKGAISKPTFRTMSFVNQLDELAEHGNAVPCFSQSFICERIQNHVHPASFYHPHRARCIAEVMAVKNMIIENAVLFDD